LYDADPRAGHHDGQDVPEELAPRCCPTRRPTSNFNGSGFTGEAGFRGSTDRYGSGPDRDPCAPADICATLFQALGVPPTHEVQTPSRRRMPIFREGWVLEGLLA
jgi:hypothetical protein